MGNLSGEQVDALFRHEAVTSTDQASPVRRERPYVLSYDRCGHCGHQMPGLFTFNGRTEWKDAIPLDDPLRDAVELIRKAFGEQTVLLCDWCIQHLGKGNYDPDKIAADGAEHKALRKSKVQTHKGATRTR